MLRAERRAAAEGSVVHVTLRLGPDSDYDRVRDVGPDGQWGKRWHDVLRPNSLSALEEDEAYDEEL
jgi:hypothetical protein